MKQYIWLLFFYSLSLYSNQILEIKESINLIDFLKENEHYTIYKQNFFLKPQNFDLSKIIFYLDCEASTIDYLIDKRGNYSLHKKEIYLYEYPLDQKEYITKKKEKACYFYNRKNKILIQTTKAQWPNIIYPNSNLQFSKDFSISFWFFPLTFNLKEQNILYWNSFSEDKHKQFKIYLEQGNLKLKLKNLLFSSNKAFDIDQILISRNQLEEEKNWKHFFLSFSISKSQIIIFLNHTIQKIIILPKDVELDFSNQDVPPIQIGKDYLGFLDEFYILNQSYEVPITFFNFSDFSLEHKSGRMNLSQNSYFTPIIDISKDTHQILIDLEYFIPKGTFLKIEYTTFDKIEQLKTHEHYWNILPLDRYTYHTKFTLEREKFGIKNKYLQFKITMIQDSKGMYTPILKNFYLKKIRFSSISPPKNLKIIPELSNENQICLEWEVIPEEEVENYGGYKIHIGIREKEFSFVLDQTLQNSEWKIINKKNTDFPITEKEKIFFENRKQYFEQYRRNHIRIILKKEDLIRYYENFISESQFSRNRIPILFEKNRIYYFAVSAYKNQGYVKSKLSNIVEYQF